MKLEHIDHSIVVVADRHNPSILHPSFLENQNIIEKGLALAEPALSSADISIASFENGLRFSVDNTRLQITNSKIEEGNVDISKVASAYVKVLPHVGYKSVGCNLFSFIEIKDAEKFLIDKFIKQGPWNEGDILLKSAGIRFVYHKENSVINLSYDAGIILKNGEEARRGILIRGNSHTEVSSSENTISEINGFDSKINAVVKYISNTFGINS
ncbi:MAG: hypothetical protein ACR65O_05000 [Methylomicrobium sp.]